MSAQTTMNPPSPYAQSVEILRLAKIFEEVGQSGRSVTSVPTTYPLGAMIPVQRLPSYLGRMIKQVESISGNDSLAPQIRENLQAARQALTSFAIA
jgi:hypothetical protein